MKSDYENFNDILIDFIYIFYIYTELKKQNTMPEVVRWHKKIRKYG